MAAITPPPKFERQPDIIVSGDEWPEWARRNVRQLRVGTLIKAGERYIERIDARRYRSPFALYAEQLELFEI